MMKKTNILRYGLSLLIALIGGELFARGSGQPAAGGEVTLRFNTSDSGIYSAPMQLVADRYMRENPGVKIIMEEVPDSYIPKLMAQISSNTAPDLIQLNEFLVKDLGRQGLVLDLAPIVKANNWDMNQYYPELANIARDGDKLYGLVKDYSSFQIYYNKKLFDVANIPYPADNWTWDECIALAKKLTDPQNTQWGLMFYSGPVPFESILFAYGGDLISPDGKKFTGYFDSPTTVKAVSDYIKWHIVDKIAPTPAQLNSMGGADLFATGRVAMRMYGPWALETYAKNPNLDLGTVRLPKGTAGRPGSFYILNYGINSNTKYKDEAFKFLTYFCGPVGADILTVMSSPAVKSVNEAFIKRAAPYWRPWLEAANELRISASTKNQHWGETGGTAFSESIDKLMQDPALDVYTVLHNAAVEADKELENLSR
jgi:multiple sugar transport system substrate-binding protein